MSWWFFTLVWPVVVFALSLYVGFAMARGSWWPWEHD